MTENKVVPGRAVIMPMSEWLALLPEPYFKRVVAQSNCNLDLDANSLSDTLQRALDWSTSDEGHDFWQRIFEMVEEAEKKDLSAPEKDAFPSLNALQARVELASNAQWRLDRIHDLAKALAYEENIRLVRQIIHELRCLV